VILSNNIIRDVIDGITVSGISGAPAKRIGVIGNQISNATGEESYALRAAWTENVSFISNIIISDYRGAHLFSSNLRMLIEDNQFISSLAVNNTMFGLVVEDILTNCRIEGNLIDNFGYKGIVIKGTLTNICIAENHFVGVTYSSGACIRWETAITSVDCMIRDNDFQGSHWSYNMLVGAIADIYAPGWSGKNNQWDKGLIRDKIVIKYKNTSGVALAVGDIVVLKNVAAGNECTTTTSQGDDLVLGMALGTIANNAFGDVLLEGKTTVLKVDGTADIAVGDFIGTFTTAKIGMKAAVGDMAFAIALEAYATNDSNGVIDAVLIKPRKI